MRRITTATWFLAMLFSSAYSHAAAFNWDNLSPTFGKKSVEDTQSGVEVKVKPAGDRVDVDDFGGTFGTTGNVIYPSNSAATDITVSFDQAVDVTSIYVFDSADTMSPISLDFTPTGGSNSVVNASVDSSSSPGTTVTLNWKGVTSFTMAQMTGAPNGVGIDALIASATASNTAPTATGFPTDITVSENTASNADLSAVTFADADADSLTVTLTASAGTLSATSGGSVTVGGSGTGTLTLAGAAADINTYLDTTSSIKYTGALNVSGNDVATITINANDGTVNPQLGSVNVDITAQAPTPTPTPSVTSVSVPANRTYAVGESLDFTVNFDYAVTADTTNGTPRLTLSVGATTRFASYLSGTGTTALLFRYTVQAGDEDKDGIALAASIDTNSGTLRSSGGVAANTTLSSVGTLTSVFVDALAPGIAEVTPVVSPTGDATPDVTFSSTEAGTLAVGGDCGSGDEGAIGSGNQTITLTKPDNSSPLTSGTYSNCTATITDSAGNASNVLTLSSFNLDASGPTVGTNAGKSLNEGDTGIIISNAALSSSDSVSNAANVTYTIVAAASKGTLRKSGNALTAGGTFTQADIDASSITYDHGGSESMTDTFTFRVADQFNNINNNAGANFTFTFAVTAVNDPPSTTADVDSTNEDNSVIVNVLGNDSDVDGSLVASSVTVVSAASNGGTAINPVTGVITYTPNANFNGEDSFTYTVKDNSGAVSSATLVTITVNAQNDAPVSVADSVSTPSNTLIAIDVAANDTDVDIGDSPDPTTIKVVANASNGNAVFNNVTNKVDYIPNTDFVGVDTFTYTIKDGAGAISKVATVTINVVDSDGDGMPDAWETSHGLNPKDANDASTDLDGDGVSNLDEYKADSDPTVDDYPPVVIAPADITVDASALFTAVDIGIAGAYDARDGSITASSNAPSQYKPGVTTVTWRATDAAGNEASDTQRVKVNPMVNFTKNQLSAEGGAGNFRIILNGQAATYPVSVPYTVSGTAATDGSDHNLSDGIAVITSGTETRVNFTVRDDGAGEGTETVVITMGTPTNAVAGQQLKHSIEIREDNVAPIVSLNAVQPTAITRIISQTGGPAKVSATVTDSNPGDSHSYDWSATDNALSDTDMNMANRTFTFDPSGFSPGVYTLQVTVSDGSASNTTKLMLRVVSALPILGTGDSDGDSIPDLTEGSGDADNDGIANYLDNISEENVAPESVANNNGFLLEAESGVKMSLGDVAFEAGNAQAKVTMDDIINAGLTQDSSDYNYPGGIFDFTVSGLPVAAQSVLVVVPQGVQIPANAVYRKYLAGVWQDFVVNANNTVASASGASGFCPPPGDAAYQDGLTEGHWCVQLTIEDGGANDADGSVNNSVDDPGGVTQMPAVDPPPAAAGSKNEKWLSGFGQVNLQWLMFIVLTGLVGRIYKGRK